MNYREAIEKLFGKYERPVVEDITLGFSGIDPQRRYVGTDDHEILRGLLGGDNDGHYHLTQNELKKVNNIDTKIEAAFDEVKHEELPDLQGGDTHGHYHLTNEELVKVRGIDNSLDEAIEKAVDKVRHNSLPDLQGGNAQGHFHLTTEELLKVQKLPAEGLTVKVGTVSTGAAGSSVSITNSGTPNAAVLNFTIPRGDKGEKGNPFTYGDFTVSQLEALKGAKGDKGDTGAQGIQGVKGDKGDPFRYEDFTLAQINSLKGAKGDKGDTGATGAQGIQGIQGAKGDKGADGKAATIRIGSVTTGAAGTSVIVTNSGTDNAAVLNFTIPRGNKGDKGDTGATGAQGIQGIQGAKGDKGTDGQAATIRIGSVTTGAAGTSASVTNSGTTTNAVLNFTIPKGDKGEKGEVGSGGSGTSVNVVDNLTSNSSISALSANQGRILNEKIKGLDGAGNLSYEDWIFFYKDATTETKRVVLLK